MISKLSIEKLSREEIFLLEKNLQNESDALLEEYGVVGVLKDYGVPIIKGSKLLQVMCTRNIDIFLHTNQDLMQTWFDLCKRFLQVRGIRRIHPINYYDYDRDSNYLEKGNKGFGYFISFDSLKSNKVVNSKEWDFEISIVNEVKEDDVDRLINNWDKMINDEKREIILRIKMFISPISSELKKLGKGKLKSVEIYKAVLVDNVKSIDEFINWYQAKETNSEKLEAFNNLVNKD